MPAAMPVVLHSKGIIAVITLVVLHSKGIIADITLMHLMNEVRKYITEVSVSLFDFASASS